MKHITVTISIDGPSKYVTKKWWQLMRVMETNRTIKNWLIVELGELRQEAFSDPHFYIEPEAKFEATFVKTK
jgi:hypothetical protein